MTYPNGPDSPVIPLAFGPTTVDLPLMSTDGILSGWSIIETTGAAAAELDLYDGASVNGILIAAIALQPGQSTRDNMPRIGVAIQRGLFLHVVSGSIRGSIWVVRK